MKLMQHALAVTLLGAALLGHTQAQGAANTESDGVKTKVSGTVTFGTMVRMEDANPSDYAYPPSTMVPSAAPGQLVGSMGGADLNYEKHHAVSTVLKALVDLDVRGQQSGFFARGSAWTDFTLGHANAAYGNYPNRYQTNTTLSDDGFDREARFNGLDLLDVYAWHHMDLSEGKQLDARLGRQVLNWGTAQFTTGGINSAINPLNLAAQVRPGSLPQEGKVPLSMLNLKLALSPQWSAEGFLALESRTTVLPGCGTFMDVSSILVHGCMLAGAVPRPYNGTPMSTVDTLTEQAILSSGYYVHRDTDENARRGGQFGLAMRFKSEPLHTDFGAYAMNMHSSMPYLRIKVEDINGSTLPPGLANAFQRLSDPNGLRYAATYPENIQVYGLSFDSKLNPASNVYGEVAYRPNQPLSMNATDLLNAFLLRSPTAMLQQSKDVLAIPAGGSFNAYDRFHVTTASLGSNRVMPKLLGSTRVVMSGEVGISHVANLPDPLQMRYGRSLAYGGAPYLVNGSLTACSEAQPGLSGVPGKTCTTDGFITSNAWGLRGRVAAVYADALWGAQLTPSLFIAKDVDGYSFDGTYSKGRTTMRLGLRADWSKTFYTDIQYTRFTGGHYNLLSDRDNVMLAAGANF